MVVEDTEATGTAGTPAQVTGLAVSGNYLTWDSQNMTAYGYDVKATNAAGMTFYSWKAYSETEGYKYGMDVADSHYYTIRENCFKLSRGLYNDVPDAKYLTPGASYKYQVRAVNRVSTTNAAGNTTYTYTYGPWSSAVSFTIPSTYTTYTGVTVDTKNTSQYTLFLNLGKKAGGFYQIYVNFYTDAACTQKVNSWSSTASLMSNTTVARVYTGSLTAGKTYYARLYEAADSYSDDTVLAQAGVKLSNVVAFTVPSENGTLSYTTVPAMTKLTVVKTDTKGIYLNTALSATLTKYSGSNEIYYEYSADGDTWYSRTQTDEEDMYLSYSTLASVTGKPNAPVYIRAKATVLVNGSYVDTAYSNTVTVKSPAVSAIKNLTYEQTANGYELRYTGDINSSVETVYYQYSKTKNFADNYTSVRDNKNVAVTTGSTLWYSSLEMGSTYYVRAFVRSDYYDDNSDTIYGDLHSGFTNVLTIKTVVPKASVYAGVEATEVRLNLGNEAGVKVTGYEVARKNGKTYKVLGKTTDSIYTDRKLKSDTEYTYRVRAYYFNTKTQKTVYGEPAYVSATTWGAPVNLKATPASATSVKLTWSKVSGANGYEIYRYVGDGITKLTNTTSYEGNGYFEKAQLIKKITKSTVKTYTDKGLASGANYYYVVRAYRVKNGKTYYISEGAYAELGLTTPTIIDKTQSTKTGKLTVTWKRVIAANGYLIEKKDAETGKWTTVKKITKNSTVKYTFPAVTGKYTSAEYRIRAYSGKKYSSPVFVTVKRSIAAVSGVKATAKNGQITVSWKKVPGADYYKVYRTTSSRYYTDALTGKIQRQGNEVYNYVPDTYYSDGYRTLSYVTTTSLVDKKISYINNFGEEIVVAKGPESGVKYYYYVVAYKIVDEDYNAAEAAANETLLTNFAAVSSYGCAKPVSAKVSAAKPATPSVKSVKSSKKKQVTVTLSKKVNGAVKYEVYRSTNSKKGFTLVGTTTKTTFTDKKATSGKTYYYKVRAVKYDDVGIEVYSNYSKVSKSVKVK